MTVYSFEGDPPSPITLNYGDTLIIHITFSPPFVLYTTPGAIYYSFDILQPTICVWPSCNMSDIIIDQQKEGGAAPEYSGHTVFGATFSFTPPLNSIVTVGGVEISNIAAAPEPSMWVCLFLGLAMLSLRKRAQRLFSKRLPLPV